MAGYLVSDIATLLGKVVIRDDAPVRNILIDSRNINSPADSLFFALTGVNHNGHDYIGELYDKGVRAFVVSRKDNYEIRYPEATFILVPDTLQALQSLAAHHRKKFSIPVVAVTGSNGKTIVKEWLYHTLALKKNIVRSPRSYNSQVGVPLSLWLLQEENDLAVFEAGISRPGEMKKLAEMIMPDTGIFTNIGEAHQENFKNPGQKTAEKLQLFRSCKAIIYCSDHDLIHRSVQKDPKLKKATLFTWSSEKSASLRITGTCRESGFTTITGRYAGKEYRISIPFHDDASVENAIHIWAYLLQSGQFSKQTAAQMKSLPPVAMRLELKKGINHCTLINDSYNSDINSLAIALDTLNMQSQHERRIVILSDLFQTGMKEELLYKKIAALLKEKKVTRFVGIGPALSRNKQLFGLPATFYETTESFLAVVSSLLLQDEAILIKGSRQFEFEKISSALEEKKHNTRLEINLNALVSNLNYYRSLLREDTMMMVMVKALSYGSGSYEIANVLQFQRVDYLGAAIADEGAELRNAGITVPIMVMNPDHGSFDMIIRNRLEPEIFNFTSLKLFEQAVIRNQETGYPVHLKIDSGMHRLGFLEEETEKLCSYLKNNRNIIVKSVFSHLAATDEPVHDKFSVRQINAFVKTAATITGALGYPVIRHILNSSGIERFPEAQFEMVRLGIGIYGFSPSNQKKLRNVHSLKSTILQVKLVRANETVGYGRAGKAKKDTVIGVVPVGYADGLDRRLGRGIGKFLINDKFAPIIGNICMDMCMVDLTGIDAQEGDEVVIFGDKYPMTEMAKQLHTIPYEILTGVSHRVKRIYYHE
jgi:alanine racemase